MECHDIVLITAETYPAIFAAFELISHDCGRQAGHRNYAIPDSYLPTLAAIEHNLNALRTNADGDFDCLCTGDEEDRKRIVEGWKLHVSDELLQRFFEEFS